MINGIESLVYAVDDLELCTRYFVDFGLPLLASDADHAHFLMDEGSSVILRRVGDPLLPSNCVIGTGVHEVIWGVNSESSLQRLVRELEVDRPVVRDEQGTFHLKTDDGFAIGLKVFHKQPLTSAPSPLNSPGNINRINQHRKWISRARPKCIQHVVFQSPDVDKSWAFYRDRLHFRVSDIQKGFGVFGRAPAANDHHNVYFLNANLPFKGPDVWGMDGHYRFDHANFGVDDLDEVMVGTNHMQRQGWPESHWGLGRHRIASSLFVYLPCPTGGQAEYGADSDHLDDQWTPRVWNPMFAFFSFITHMAPFMIEEAPWEYSYATPEQANRLSFTGQPLAGARVMPTAVVASE